MATMLKNARDDSPTERLIAAPVLYVSVQRNAPPTTSTGVCSANVASAQRFVTTSSTSTTANGVANAWLRGEASGKNEWGVTDIRRAEGSEDLTYPASTVVPTTVPSSGFPLPTLRDAPPLPIDTVLPAVATALADRGVAVVVAAPGAGKTTRLPLALLDAPWRGDGRILVLEPRRLAARAAAEQMARLLGEPVGRRVGYRVRLDARVSAATRVEVLTEGIFTRMVQDDPSLEGIAAVLFDEFHERHIGSDLGLALALESRAVLRPDVRLVVMSATLEAAPVARLLGDSAPAPVIVSEGREHPVTTAYRPPRDGVPMALAVANAVRSARREHGGDVLVFLPGIAELQRVRAALEDEPLDARVELLHGSLALEEQDRVLRPRTPGARVILSTAIAESSVTLDGVRVVVDAGLARVPRFDARSGMTRLETIRVSRAAADQRRGQRHRGHQRPDAPRPVTRGSGWGRRGAGRAPGVVGRRWVRVVVPRFVLWCVRRERGRLRHAGHRARASWEVPVSPPRTRFESPSDDESRGSQ